MAGTHILIVEDNHADVFLIREAIAGAGIDGDLRGGEIVRRLLDC